MNIYKRSIVYSVVNKINKSRSTGKLDFGNIDIYNTVAKYIDITYNEFDFVNENKTLNNIISEIKYKYSNDICNYKTLLPTSYIKQGSDIENPSEEVAPVAQNFTVTNIVQETLFNTNTTVSTYYFNATDFINNFNGINFTTLIIHRNGNNLNGSIKYNSSPTSGNIYGNTGSDIRINRNDVSNWSFYSNSTDSYTHEIEYSLIDEQTGLQTNRAYFTVDRSGEVNLPPTLGDITVIRDNRTTTIITLSMLTTQLTPPYNDPEGDALDAIRIDEISTANKGKFYLDGIEISEGQIITKQNILDEFLTHEGADQDSIWSDNFSFSARDSGSKIWVK